MIFDLFFSLFLEHGYWIVFAGVLLDTAGLPLPGELFLLALGAVARTGHVDPALGILVASAAAMGGDNFGYWLGRMGGQRLLDTYCRVTLGSGMCLQKAVAFYRLRGPVALVFGRFVIGVRALLLPLAGSARMPYSRFLLFDGVGALVWAALYVLAGYAFGWQMEGLRNRYHSAATVIVAILAAGFALYLLMKLHRRHHGRPVFRDRTVARLGELLGGHAGPRGVISLPPATTALAPNELREDNGKVLQQCAVNVTTGSIRAKCPNDPDSYAPA